MLFGDGVAVNNDPSVSVHPTIHPVKPDYKFRFGPSARQYAIEQYAPLKAITIGETD